MLPDAGVEPTKQVVAKDAKSRIVSFNPFASSEDAPVLSDQVFERDARAGQARADMKPIQNLAEVYVPSSPTPARIKIAPQADEKEESVMQVDDDRCATAARALELETCYIPSTPSRDPLAS